MPTSRRRLFRSLLEMPAPKVWPQTEISPSLMISRWSMQRSAVLLPDPLWPMMATISPFLTLRSTPFRTWLSPNHLWTFLRRTISVMESSGSRRSALVAGDRQLALQLQADPGKRIADDEVQGGGNAEIQERLEGGVVQDLGVVGEFGETDHQGSKRRVLHDLDHESDRWRGGDAQGLWQDDLEHALDAVQSQAFGRFPLVLRNGFDAAAPDLAQEGRRVDGERQDRREHGRRLREAQDRGAVEAHAHDDQQRRALDEVDVAERTTAQRLAGGDAHERDGQSQRGREDEGQDGQLDGAPCALKKIEDLI